MAGIPWTAKEDGVLTRSYKRQHTATIADRLGRTCSAVHQRTNRLGLSVRRDERAIAARKRRIPKLLATGRSDSEIAQAVGMDRRALSAMRQRMGIPANGRNARYRKRVAKTTREQCKKAGVKNLAQVRAIRYRQFAADIGWPGLSVRAAQIADALYRLGPMTRKQICAATGMPWKGSRKSLGSNRCPGGSYMAELQSAGIVVRLPAAIAHGGRGNREDLYMIGLEVEPCQNAR